jgi:hypothetical protein
MTVLWHRFGSSEQQIVSTRVPFVQRINMQTSRFRMSAMTKRLFNYTHVYSYHLLAVVWFQSCLKFYEQNWSINSAQFRLKLFESLTVWTVCLNFVSISASRSNIVLYIRVLNRCSIHECFWYAVAWSIVSHVFTDKKSIEIIQKPLKFQNPFNLNITLNSFEILA